MDTASGSVITFFEPVGDGRSVRTVYTTDAGIVAPDPADFFTIEVFTGTNPGFGTIDPGFDGAVFIENASPLSSDSSTVIGSLTVFGQRAIAPTFNVTLLAGDFELQEEILPTWPGRTQPAIITLGIGAQTVRGSVGDTIIGGSGSATQEIVAGISNSVLGGSAPLIVNANSGTGSPPVTVTGSSGPVTVFASDGSDQITGGSGGITVVGNQPFVPGGSDAGPGNTIAGSASEAGSMYVAAGIGDTIIGGLGPTTVWAGGGGTLAPGLSDSITGGAGDMTVAGGGAASQLTVTGGSGATVLVNLAGQSSITGGSGSLEIDDPGKNNTIAGGTGTLIVRGNYSGNSGNLITGGTGTDILPTVTGFSGENTAIVGGPGDTITGGTGLTYIDGHAGGQSITGGAGSATGTVEGQAGVNTAIVGGPNDTILAGAGATYIDARSFVGPETIIGGSGALRVLAGSGDLISGGSGPATIVAGGSDTIAGGVGTLQVNLASNISGETIALAAGHGVTTLRDLDRGSGGTATTVVGFSAPDDLIASANSVDASNSFLGSSNVVGGNTVLTFLDGATLVLVGVTDPATLHFTQ